jgi:CubicO group peptidase (beta-lactamase class C family)
LAALPVVAADAGYQDLGLMQGFPPDADKRVLRSNFMEAPRNRWAFQHIRELQPTREIWRGDGPVSNLRAKPLDLGPVKGPVREGRVITLDQFLDESHTDGFLILHRGRVVFERYMNGQQRHVQHQMFSATKSFVGTTMLALVSEGKVDPGRTVGSYIPELRKSAFGDATVQQVLDMTTGVSYTEAYDDPDSDIWRYGRVFGLWGVPPPGYTGPRTIYDYLPTLEKKGEHGHGFHYVTPNTDVLGWIIRRVTGKSVDQNIAERFLHPKNLGALAAVRPLHLPFAQPRAHQTRRRYPPIPAGSRIHPGSFPHRTGARTTVRQTPPYQVLQCRRVGLIPPTLVHHRSVPRKPQPLQRAQDVIGCAGHLAWRVQVVDAHVPLPSL